MRTAGSHGGRIGWLRRYGGDISRLAVVLMLLGLASVGVRARQSARVSTVGLLDQDTGLVAEVLAVTLVAVACAGLILSLARRRRRKRRQGLGEPDHVAEPLLTGWQRAIGVAIALLVFASPIFVLLFGHHFPKHLLRLPALTHQGRAGHAGTPLPAGAGSVITTFAVLAGLTLLAVLTVLIVRRLRQHAVPAPQQPAGGTLADMIEAGSQALESGDHPRQAIIACYAAMEDALARAGTARRVADTPGEFLDRAMGAGLIRTLAGRRLTGLFREARFSPHAVGHAHRRAAREALDEIIEHLGARP